MSGIRDKLIKAGVDNLQEFGYPECNSTNILTDLVYSKFFINMLEENKGYSGNIDKVIDELITEISKEK